MARYRKIDTRIWGDARFRRLSAPEDGCAQFLWIYMLTNPSTTNIPGLFTAGRAQIAEALGWTAKGFDKGFRELFREGLAKGDFEARVIWIPKAILHNPPENPNVVKSWRISWDEIPECDLKAEAWEELNSFFSNRNPSLQKAFAESCPNPLAKGMAKGIRKGLPKGMANQEQEQEQDQDPSLRSGSARATPAAPTIADVPTHPRMTPPPDDLDIQGCLLRLSNAGIEIPEAHRAALVGEFLDFARSKGERSEDWVSRFASWARTRHRMFGPESLRPGGAPAAAPDDDPLPDYGAGMPGTPHYRPPKARRPA